ncbi:3-hydroxy-3-methylglutaryl CoA synthase [Geothermobacter ehrlichii]|uniref:3-hydroxy-3-methylglutaryl CoA synthase n=1 Tax=Geothermobacter ehrlichii TaxID=213224 RepID=A0A5D3WJN6_9BACT|nr:OB-fold domain-containing protein [Geothermobacter ehrlichii]TYO98424.1 3-hydroxy-3-methylglutaryl CoA synthase [Geothermobacter ehrlichii]
MVSGHVEKIGITAYGGYLPRLRLQRKSIADANAWFDASLNGLAKGEKAMCNWDEDAITMAVEACADCMGEDNNDNLISLVMASTSMPFLDRQNSVVVAEALNLKIENLRTMDVTSSQRAATSALLSALDVAAMAKGEVMLVASEHRRALSASREEMLYGDGAAALKVGTHHILAELVATHSQAVDFIDHYRNEVSEFDYVWEERWIRDEGYMKIIPGAVDAILKKTEISPADINHFIVPNDQAGKVAKLIGVENCAVVETMSHSVGISGAAHPILMFAKCLENAKPGELIMVVGFGQGCDVLLFRATDLIQTKRPKCGVSGFLNLGSPEVNYNKYISFNGLLKKDYGKRSEIDKQAYLPALYRNRNLVNEFKGGRCKVCNTIQIPKRRYCINPDCDALDSQENYPLSGVTGRVVSWTADRLTFDYSPPAYFGMVEFEPGGRMMMDFTDVNPDEFDTGINVSLCYRIKQIDDQRGFRKYFWKARPNLK